MVQYISSITQMYDNFDLICHFSRNNRVPNGQTLRSDRVTNDSKINRMIFQWATQNTISSINLKWIITDSYPTSGWVIASSVAPRSYLVNTPEGTVRRNRHHLQLQPNTPTTESEVKNMILLHPQLARLWWDLKPALWSVPQIDIDIWTHGKWHFILWSHKNG